MHCAIRWINGSCRENRWLSPEIWRIDVGPKAQKPTIGDDIYQPFMVILRNGLLNIIELTTSNHSSLTSSFTIFGRCFKLIDLHMF